MTMTKTKPNDLIDLTDEEEKSKGMRNFLNHVSRSLFKN